MVSVHPESLPGLPFLMDCGAGGGGGHFESPHFPLPPLGEAARCPNHGVRWKPEAVSRHLRGLRN